jgi:hypothetical protein
MGVARTGVNSVGGLPGVWAANMPGLKVAVGRGANVEVGRGIVSWITVAGVAIDGSVGDPHELSNKITNRKVRKV